MFHQRRRIALALFAMAVPWAHAMTDEEARACFESGNAAMAAKQYAQARAAFLPVARQGAPLAGHQGLAWLRIIETHLRENNPEAARQACETLCAEPGIAPHLCQEAQERLRVFSRTQTGLPARDPTQTRSTPPPPITPARIFHVAPNGNDAHPGSREQPFATPQRAIDALRALMAEGLPVGGAMISLREGEYCLSRGLCLDAALSGRPDAPIVIAAGAPGTARLTGGRPLPVFQPVDDPAILARLPGESRGKTLAADLKALRISEVPPLMARGFGCNAPPAAELFIDGAPMTPARWPNQGFVRTGKVLDPGLKTENRGAMFEFTDDRPARWTQAPDIWLYGYWFHDWADNAIAVASIDTAARRIHTAHTSPYGIKENQAYYAYNLLEEIDQPGEWYLDRDAGMLYLYPPLGFDARRAAISLLPEPLLRIENAAHVRVQGLVFELGAADAIHITGGDQCLIAACSVRQMGGTGIVISGGRGHGLLSCDLHTLGRGGAVLAGGDRKTLTPAAHFIENCHIHHFSRIDRTYTPAVQIEGVGNRIAHNDFHHSSCHAIRLEGNDHLVEYNNIHDVVLESDDQGGLDMFLNPAYRGNVLRYNFWHDIHNGRACGQAGIRLDDAICGTLIYGNVFYNCSGGNFGGVQIHGGKDNWVDNNIFAECKYGVSFSPWGADRWASFLAGEGIAKRLKQEVDIDAPPYNLRYPELQRINSGNDVNRIWRNLVYRCGAFLARDQGIQITINNLVSNDDPGFLAPEQANFALKQETPLYDAIGFAPIPFTEIGLYQDAFRDANRMIMH